MAVDMLEPSKFPSLDSCQRKFLWTHKEVDLAPYPIVGLVLQVRDAFGIWFQKPGQSSSKVQTSTEDNVGDKRLVRLNLLTMLTVLHRQTLFNVAISAIAKAILMWVFTEQVPSLHIAAPRYLKRL